MSVPDLIIIDILMPEMDGISAVIEIRKIVETPIIFVTAIHGVDNVVQGLQAGADDYLEKPYDNRELLLRVKALLKRSKYESLITFKTEAKVFISYSRFNWLPSVKRVVNKFDDANIRHFVDKNDIPRGTDWYDVVNEALETSVAMVLCVTPESLRSPHVKNEYRFFLGRKSVLPLICVPTTLPFELQSLNHYQYSELDKLIEDLKKMLNQ